MKALVKSRRGAGPLAGRHRPGPTIGINDVLIRVLRTGICGTDVHIYKWDDWAQKTIPVPMAIGHEFVGEIVEVGSNVTDFFPGRYRQRRRSCGLRALPQLPGRPPPPLRTHHGRGGEPARRFCRIHCAADDQYLAARATSESADVAAIFDPFGNAVHTALSFPVLGEDVLITGAGPIGIMAAAVVRMPGARFVVVTDLNPYRLELAPKMGATLAVNVQRDSAARRAKAARDARKASMSAWRCRATQRPSATCSPTWPWGEDRDARAFRRRNADRLEHQVIFNMLTIKGIYGREMYETWYKMTVMLESGLDITPVITHRFATAISRKDLR